MSFGTNSSSAANRPIFASSIFAPLGSCVVPCQAIAVYRGEQGQRARLIQPADAFANDPRGLAIASLRWHGLRRTEEQLQQLISRA